MAGQVLIIRPQPDADKLAQQLAHLQISYLVDPVLHIVSQPHLPLAAAPGRAWVVTSAQALRHGHFTAAAKRQPLFVVGDETEAVALEHGFHHVTTGPKDSAALAQTILKAKEAQSELFEHLAYVRGQDCAYDLQAEFQTYNIKVLEYIVYAAMPASQLGNVTQTALRQGRVSLIPFYSARSARVFMQLAAQAGLRECFTSITALSISKNVLDCVQDAGWYKTYTASVPRGAAMRDLIQQIAQKL
ncbi:MAG: uroporphyrinogen-III synthase [Alphaproteobacteria bacterium]|nr:uroporphyrinogen-III synthase [Alphaproteobacteria bacterium]